MADGVRESCELGLASVYASVLQAIGVACGSRRHASLLIRWCERYHYGSPRSRCMQEIVPACGFSRPTTVSWAFASRERPTMPNARSVLRRTACLAILVLAVPAMAEVSAERLARVDGFLDSYVDAGRIPGAVLQVTFDGETVYHRAAGIRDREGNAPMQPDTIFRIASMSKAVVSAAVMMLQERGTLLITQPVGDFLPEYAATTVAVASEDGSVDVVDATRPITIRDLLTHTAGIGYGYGPAAAQWQAANLQHWYFGHRDEPIRETVRRIAQLPMDAQPGEGFVYGYNTDILGALVEVASGQTLDAFLEAEIFGPLSMVDTSFYLAPEKAARLAAVYSLKEDGALVRPAGDTPSTAKATT